MNLLEKLDTKENSVQELARENILLKDENWTINQKAQELKREVELLQSEKEILRAENDKLRNEIIQTEKRSKTLLILATVWSILIPVISFFLYK